MLATEPLVVRLESVDISKESDIDSDLWDTPLDPSCNQKRYQVSKNSNRNINRIKEHYHFNPSSIKERYCAESYGI